MKYEIKGGSFPVVVCHLENNEQMIAESGSMTFWIPPTEWPENWKLPMWQELLI